MSYTVMRRDRLVRWLSNLAFRAIASREYRLFVQAVTDLGLEEIDRRLFGHERGCRPDPKHPGYWLCTTKGHGE